MLLAFFWFTASQCSKPPLVLKPLPVPEKRPSEGLLRETQRTIEVNGRWISPLVPTLFLLPEDPLVIRTHPLSPSFLYCQEASSPTYSGTSATGGYQPVVYREPPTVKERNQPCLELESWTVALNGQSLIGQQSHLFYGTAPKEPGLYTMEITGRQKWRQATAMVPKATEGEREEKTRQSLLVIILHPFSRLTDGFIDQFPLGFYPNGQEPLLKTVSKTLLPLYLPPRGFIQVTPENQGVSVSRHFRLQDFMCRFKTPFPHYMALSPDLLLKLELLTLKLQAMLGPEAGLTILSGFRTPWYNLSVSSALWSRHIYGDAADVTIIGSSQDGSPDDSNHRGPNTLEDLTLLAGMIEDIERETGLVGGLGLYDWGENKGHRPFLHIDTRGVKARW